MIKDHQFEINYIFRNQPMADAVDAHDETMAQHEAAHYLIRKHQAELGDTPPAADAREEDIHHFARDHGITDIRVSKVHTHPKGDTPGHYKQP